MAHAGEVIVNPVTGEHLKFLQTAADTNGQLLRAQVTVTPQQAILPLHIHRSCNESVELQSGRLGIQLGAKRTLLGPGGSVVVPAGVPHTWWNDGTEEVRFTTEVAPAGSMELAFEALYGLARDGKVLVLANRMIPTNVFEMALILRVAETYGAEPPVPIVVQDAVYIGLAALARRLGYRPDFPQYRDVSMPNESTLG